LYHTWAREVIARGGTVSAEHGVGKMKVTMLRDMVGTEGVQVMRQVKTIFDPDGLLCMGNVFDEDVIAGEKS
ncbi:MAG TPA: FAD-linked oxidase C-terminal domain-containing protein, partial [Bacillota bacterium]|nr:FAD-linked oxidase C-terminal domain-containing protein [Bacillota bacterium]